MGLNQAELEAVDQLIAMGIELEPAQRAVEKHGINLEAAMESIFETAAADDGPPPLISVDDDELPPPYGPPNSTSDLYGPIDYRQVAIRQPNPSPSTSVVPFTPRPTTVIDLTGEDDNARGGTSQGDADLERALKLSTESDDFDKALAMSMSDLKGIDGAGGGPIDSIRPEDRVREGQTPTILRSTSPLLGVLAAYLQCLFAVPTWRHAVLNFQPTQADLGSRHDFAGYWRGDDVEVPQGTLAGPTEHVWQIVALQRLFALMTETRRSFLHITEITKVLDPEGDFSGADDMSCVKALHAGLVDTFRKLELRRLRELLRAGLLPEYEYDQQRGALSKLFSLTGRSIPNDDSIGLPLPPPDASESEPVAVVEINLRTHGDEPQDLVDAIDASLVTTSMDGQRDREFSLLTTLPDSLVFNLHRAIPEFSNLDSFGGGETKRHVFRPLPEIYLDRYWIKNRVKIAEGRAKLRQLQKQLEQQKSSRKHLSTTKDGQDGVDLVRNTLKYMQIATSEDRVRAARQQRLAKQYVNVLAEMERKIQIYDDTIASLQTQIDDVFDSPEMRKQGPYQLCAILMRSGLNGRGSTWSVVRDDEGRWWKITDLLKEEVTLEEALADPSGLMMNAGASMLFYQNANARLQPVTIPAFLQDAALEDNHAFATFLPADFVSSWNLPPLPEPDPDWIDNDAPPATTERHTEIIEFSTDEICSPPAVDLDVPEDAMDVQLPTPAPTTPTEDGLGSGAMSVDGDGGEVGEVGEIPSDSEEILRLRGGGGASEEGADEEEGEYDDDDEIDEDEVELGCLKPMPTPSSEWDVDFAVGKVGGVPRYLDPTSPLSREDVVCGVCGGTMSLLLQVNSPDDERPHAAARSLYLFACRVKDCMTKDSGKATKVWRVQMPSPNAFFPHTPESQARRKALEDALDPSTGLIRSPPSSSPTCWPEWDVACEPEPYEESYLANPVDKSTEDGANGEDAAEPDTATGVDAAFLAFQDRIERVPQQVLRFYRLPGIDDPQPLWANNSKIRPQDIPCCPLCDGPRQVEFQVLSTLLTFLKDDLFQFDSLLVYTCVDNCAIPSRGEDQRTGWAEEYLVGQTFGTEGVSFGRP